MIIQKHEKRFTHYGNGYGKQTNVRNYGFYPLSASLAVVAPPALPCPDCLTQAVTGVCLMRDAMELATIALKAPARALDRLIGLSLTAIRDATEARLSGRYSGPRWQAEMERAIKTAFTAAHLTATAQRLGYDPDSPLFARNRLTRAERQDIAAAVTEQMRYLRGFVADIRASKLSPAQISARADMYGPAIKAFYLQQRWYDWEIPDHLLPGNQKCLGNCLCRGHVSRDNGDGTGVWTRELGGTEMHCDECPQLAGDHPVKRRRAA